MSVPCRLIADYQIEEIDVVFKFEVHEALTGRLETKTSILTMYQHNYNLSFINRFLYFKPGLRNTAFVSHSSFNFDDNNDTR